MPNHDHRRRVALACGGVAAVLASLAVVAAAWPTGAHHHAATPRRAALSTLILGDCFDGGPETVTVRPCAEPHQGEVIGTAELTVPPRSPDETDEESRDGCEQLRLAHLTDEQLARATGLSLMYPPADGKALSARCALTSGQRVRGTLWQRLGVPPEQYRAFSLTFQLYRFLQRGECFTLPPSRHIPDEVGVVPCDQPHDSVTLTKHADADALYSQQEALELCREVGPPPGSQPMVRVPTESDWGNGNHAIPCVATSPTRRTTETVTYDN